MTVYLVGAGPGDPELISVRGARLLGAADVVIHDRLARPLLGLASPSAEIIDVGKARGATPVPQREINDLLVSHGRRHGCVVRLKGGDPLVFARGAEEAAVLCAAGVDFELVPGISAALAAPSAAGVPLTLRGVLRSFTVLTGHEDPRAAPADYWHALVALHGTIVVLMAARHIRAIAACLIDAGMAPATPVAAIHAATTGAEQVERCRLDALAESRLPPPVTYVIGESAALDLRRPTSMGASRG